MGLFTNTCTFRYRWTKKLDILAPIGYNYRIMAIAMLCQEATAPEVEKRSGLKLGKLQGEWF